MVDRVLHTLFETCQLNVPWHPSGSRQQKKQINAIQRLGLDTLEIGQRPHIGPGIIRILGQIGIAGVDTGRFGPVSSWIIGPHEVEVPAGGVYEKRINGDASGAEPALSRTVLYVRIGHSNRGASGAKGKIEGVGSILPEDVGV
jgi:hypothetical protein